jgi:hypothetical protein
MHTILPTTLCYHSQITTTSWREVQYLTNIFGTPLVYRPNSASWIVCCSLEYIITILKFLQVSIQLFLQKANLL